MAGTVTYTAEDLGTLHGGRPIRKVTIDWLSTAGGVADAQINGAVGLLHRVVTIPDAVDAPTTLYDILLKDNDSGAAFSGTTLNDRSATVAEAVDFADKLVYKPKVDIAAAGASKKGKIILYLLR